MEYRNANFCKHLEIVNIDLNKERGMKFGPYIKKSEKYIKKLGRRIPWDYILGCCKLISFHPPVGRNKQNYVTYE